MPCPRGFRTRVRFPPPPPFLGPCYQGFLLAFPVFGTTVAPSEAISGCADVRKNSMPAPSRTIAFEAAGRGWWLGLRQERLRTPDYRRPIPRSRDSLYLGNTHRWIEVHVCHAHGGEVRRRSQVAQEDYGTH